ncbi:hypothetical protein WMY93_001823 [Mugilogobius chulae]|uniref:deoxyribonuclease II n=1 Tax=Mugilogobius chulae TaxID=88201 RepID=A0AAW0Q1M1_9GOBI
MLLLLSLVLVLSCADGVSVSCKNEKNEDVDWFILYKEPNGLKYIYQDESGLREPAGDVTDVLVNTLSPMLKSARNMDASFGFLSYNDQPPGCSSTTSGHSKGENDNQRRTTIRLNNQGQTKSKKYLVPEKLGRVELSKSGYVCTHECVPVGLVMGDSQSKEALWMVHSTPQFPYRRDQNHFWPDSGKVRAQTFMCVSLNYDDLETVGLHLQNIKALVYDYDLPAGFPKGLDDSVQKTTTDTRDTTRQGTMFPLSTRKAKQLSILAKKNDRTAAAGDLYVQLSIALQSDMAAQTYGGQHGRDKSFCTGTFQVLNVKKLLSWDPNQDHSKWAVTTTDWTCIGDSNRAPTQYERPGGALCINDQDVTYAFMGIMQEVEEC